MIALVIFATYAYSVGPLTPAMAFVVLSLFNTLRFPLVVLPKALRGVSGACRRRAVQPWGIGCLTSREGNSAGRKRVKKTKKNKKIKCCG